MGQVGLGAHRGGQNKRFPTSVIADIMPRPRGSKTSHLYCERAVTRFGRRLKPSKRCGNFCQNMKNGNWPASCAKRTRSGFKVRPIRRCPFLLIEDSSLARKPGSPEMEVESAYWKRRLYTHSRRDTFNVNVGGEPLVIYTPAAPFDLRERLPKAALFDSQDHPEQLPYIWCNYLHELTYAQGMHLSMQPFLLREYSRHIAELWESSTGRTAIVHAQTAVSLNFRPSQQVVDPKADLATVPLAFLRHNSWIRQLEYPRIPKDGLPNTNTISDK